MISTIRIFIGIILVFLVQVNLLAQREPLDSINKALDEVSGQARLVLLIEVASDLAGKDSESALDYIREAIVLAESQEIPEKLARAQIVMSSVFHFRDQFDSALYYANKAITYAEMVGDSTLQARARLNLSGVHGDMGHYELSIEENLKGLELIKEQEGLEDLEVSFLINLGRIKEILGDFKSADRFLQEALELSEQSGLKFRSGLVYLNLGVLHYRMGDLESSIHYNQQALNTHKALGEKLHMASALNNLGFAANLQGQYSMALDYYQQSIEIKEVLNDISGVSTTLINMAGIYNSRNNFQAAEQMSLKALKMARSIQHKDRERYALAYIVKLYESKPDYASAFRYQKELMVVRDSLFQIEKEQAIQQMLVTRENDQLKHENELKDQVNRVNQVKIQQGRYLTILIVLVLLAVWLFYLNRQTRMKNQLLGLRFKLLKSQFKPHFIFNVLNSIQRLVLKENKQLAGQYLSDFSELMRTDLNMVDLAEINLNKEIGHVVQYINLEKLRFQKEINVTIKIDEAVDGEQVMVPPMVLQPIVENCFQHAFSEHGKDNKIRIEAEKAGSGYTLIKVFDNGKVWNQQEMAENRYGLHLVEERLKLQDKRNCLAIEQGEQEKTQRTCVILKVYGQTKRFNR